MARARNPKHICVIRPGIWADESFNELSCRAKLLWLGLAGFLDCEGRGVYDPNRIVAEIFPGQAVAIQDLFEELRAAGMIEFYALEGVTYVQMLDFGRHQRRDRRRVSRLPDRDGKVADRVNEAKKESAPKKRSSSAAPLPPSVRRGLGRNDNLATGPALAIVAGSPFRIHGGDAVGLHAVVGGHQDQAFRLGLGNQHAVKGVPMVGRQAAGLVAVKQGDR